MLRSLGLTDEEAREATQETFLQAWKSIHTFRGQSKDSTWLLGIASNVGRKFLKKQKRFSFFKRTLEKEQIVEPKTTQVLPEHALEHKRNSERLTELIGHLKGKRRVIFVLYHYEELTVEEIAQALSLPKGTIRSNLQRAKGEVQQLWFSTQSTSQKAGSR